MTLRSGTPYWRVIHPQLPAIPTLINDVACQVVILGAGITGAVVADRLMQEGVDVVLIDSHEFGCGSTAASTGLLQYETDTPLVELIGKVGESQAVHAYRRGVQAIDEIETLVSELGDACGFARRDSLYFASSFWHKWRLEREFRCRKRFGFDVELLDRRRIADLFSISAPCAILSHRDAQVDPFRLTQALLNRSRNAGLRAYANTCVHHIDESDDKVVVRTPRATVEAERIVYATGYDAGQHLSRDVGTLHSTYAVVSEPLDNFQDWYERCLIWETARPYFYARQTDDGRAMIGGEDTAFSDDHERDGLIAAQTERLQKRFAQLFPAMAFVPAYSWAGTFAETKDGLAFIGRQPGRERAYFALGYGGNGITFSMIAAKLIVDMYLGRPNADADVFRFDR